MKRKKRCVRPKRSGAVRQKSPYELIGIPGDVMAGEAKIVILGDYMLELYNHKGIIDITDTQIKVNTKKAIYIVKGFNLFVSGVTDDEIDICGKILSVEREA